MPLNPQAERLNSLDKLECSEWIQTRAEITEDLDTNANRKGDGAESLPEFEPVVARCGLDELWEAFGVLAPVELAAVDDDTSDSGAMAADPFGGGGDDDVGSCFISDILKLRVRDSSE